MGLGSDICCFASAATSSGDSDRSVNFMNRTRCGSQQQVLIARDGAGRAAILAASLGAPFWGQSADEVFRECRFSSNRQLPLGKYEVTNVSITAEARLIRQAVDQVDIASTDDEARAGILDCVPVGLAGIILFPKNRKRDVSVCVFRDPQAAANWAPSAPVGGTEFIARLVELRSIRGPRKPRSKALPSMRVYWPAHRFVFGR
jgi:hypothetical protein